jgi:hypothetical protein
MKKQSHNFLKHSQAKFITNHCIFDQWIKSDKLLNLITWKIVSIRTKEFCSNKTLYHLKYNSNIKLKFIQVARQIFWTLKLKIISWKKKRSPNLIYPVRNGLVVKPFHGWFLSRKFQTSFIKRCLYWVLLGTGPSPHSKKVSLKKICTFFEISTHSASFFYFHWKFAVFRTFLTIVITCFDP